VISDVPKTIVYKLARYVNRERERIPVSSIDKPPSAELRPDQTDQDSLPPYPELDAVLELYVEDQLSEREIVQRGHEPMLVARIVRLVQRAEYKRRQAAPGLIVTRKAFGPGRRMPVARGYEEETR
jgi:NAD+ synthase (glutamine-hydrolysing)